MKSKNKEKESVPLDTSWASLRNTTGSTKSPVDIKEIIYYQTLLKFRWPQLLSIKVNKR
jgi:hypothetical protein